MRMTWKLFGLPVMAFAMAHGAAAADLPKASQKALADAKLDASFFNGLDAELAVPKAWLDGAAKEKEVVILGTWDDRQFNAMTAPFRERYPFINLRYNRSSTAARGMRVLVALSEGRVIADVLVSIADAMFQFNKMKALADLRDVPGIKNLRSEYYASDGTWIGFKLSYRCLAYHTGKVKKEDLPATWDDLLKNPRWRGGNMAVSNHPNAWLLALWGHHGEKWGVDYTRRLFEELQPQRRKEGMTAVTALTVAGEFDANIPAPEWRVAQSASKGAPVGYHCPSPVPINLSQIVMLEKATNKNGARVFINWMLSREGQLVQYTETDAVPIHSALESPQFIPFADTIIGKPSVVRDDALLGSELNERMVALWDSLWTGGTGK